MVQRYTAGGRLESVAAGDRLSQWKYNEAGQLAGVEHTAAGVSITLLLVSTAT